MAETTPGNGTSRWAYPGFALDVVLIAEWFRFGIGGMVMMILSLGVSTFAGSFAPDGAQWVADSTEEVRTLELTADASTFDAVRRTAAQVAAVPAFWPEALFGIAVGLVVFWFCRYPAFALLRWLMALSPRSERRVLGAESVFGSIHDPDPEKRAQARALYGFHRGQRGFIEGSLNGPPPESDEA